MGNVPVHESEISWSVEVVPLFQPSPHRWEYNELAAVQVCLSDDAQEWALPSSLIPQGEPVLLQHRLECRGKQEDLASIWLPVWCPTDLPWTSPDASALCPGSCEMEELWCIPRSDASFALAILSWKYLCQSHLSVSFAQGALFF